MNDDSKFSYDFENDVLFFTKKKKSYEQSFEIEDMVFDLDKNNLIVGLEILNASKHLGVDKLFLKNVLEGEMKIQVNKKFLKLKLNLKSDIRNSSKSAVYKSDYYKPCFSGPCNANFALAND